MNKIISSIAIGLVSAVALSSCQQDKKLPFYGERHAETIKDAAGVEKIDTVYQTNPNLAFFKPG